ncbi:elongin-B-like [Chionomys nivalis]|uniref:elongin-B-like n=1 Tax=Chionomys nivalis TaxID=269649 RepID=UPI0025927AEB|nr:elongin-B-like [Chionomys nivalis]
MDGHAQPVGTVKVLALSLKTLDAFLMIQHHKTTIFTDAKESSTVFKLKRIVEDILKRPPDEQGLYKDIQLLDKGTTLGECGFTSKTAGPQAPATVALAFREDAAFEVLRIEPFSSPPERPDVKPQDSGGSANEQAVQRGSQAHPPEAKSLKRGRDNHRREASVTSSERNTASSLTEFWVLVLLRYGVLRKGREEKESSQASASWDSDWSSSFAQSRL